MIFKMMLVLLMIILLSSCNQSAKPKIGVSIATMNEAVYTFMKKAMMDNKDKDAVDIIWTSAENSEAKQNSDVEGLIAQNIDVLILHSVNTMTAARLVEKANNSDIPVIAMDRLPLGAKVKMYITADSRKVGQIQAKYLAEKINGKGQVIILEGDARSSVARDISEGNREILKQYPDIKIILSQSHKDWSRDLAKLTIENEFNKYKDDIQGILANNSGMAMGAVEVLLNRKKIDSVITVGSDADKDACQSIIDGNLSADIDKMPYELGYAAYQTACKIIKNQPLDNDTKIMNNTVEVDVKFTPIKLITKENVKSDMKYRWNL